jgi:septal ring factor EnvC (AmiA/AmiB activator)
MNMKKLTSILFALGLSPVCALANSGHSVIVPQSSLMKTALPVTDEDEVAAVSRLIQTTEEQLQLQQQLKEMMIQFKKLKESFVQGDQTKKTASAMVRTARQILEMITNQHLQFHFSKDYLDELTLFSSIAGKNGIKRP